MEYNFAAVVFSIVILSTSQVANAQSVWTCSSPGFGQTGRVFIERFEISGTEVIENDGVIEHHYTILQDNEFGLVAVWSTSEREEYDHPYVGAEVIIIGKQTNEFKRSAVTNANHGPNFARALVGASRINRRRRQALDLPDQIMSMAAPSRSTVMSAQ
jgi:hypothetical protein